MRVFVSGALNSDSVGFLRNVRKMLLYGHEVLQLGVRVYIPCNDILVSLVGGCFDHEDYLKYDLMELMYCDAIFMVPGYKNSEGANGELTMALANNIPVFESLEDLKEYLEEL